MNPRRQDADAMQAPPQRWAVVASWAAFIGALGPVVWRILMLSGVNVGWPLQSMYRTPKGVAYVGSLIVLETGFAALTLGLVERWGERWPTWVPRLGGREIRWRTVAVVATVGAALLTLVVGYFLVLFAWLGPHYGWRTPMTGTPAWAARLMAAFYVPSLLWPIGLWVAIVAFVRRHSAASRGPAL